LIMKKWKFWLNLIR